jgi:hypothetical protein
MAGDSDKWAIPPALGLGLLLGVLERFKVRSTGSTSATEFRGAKRRPHRFGLALDAAVGSWPLRQA